MIKENKFDEKVLAEGAKKVVENRYANCIFVDEVGKRPSTTLVKSAERVRE